MLAGTLLTVDQPILDSFASARMNAADNTVPLPDASNCNKRSAARFARCGNARHMIKRDERNVCSEELRRPWHPLAERGERSKTHSSSRLRVRALESASYPDSERRSKRAALKSSTRPESGHFRSLPGQADVAKLPGLRVAQKIGSGQQEPGYWRGRIGGRSASSAASDCCATPCVSGHNTWLISPSDDCDMG